MKNNYVKLIIRFAVILAAVLLVSRVSRDDTTAIAGEYAGIISSDTPLGGFIDAVKTVNAQRAERAAAGTDASQNISQLAMNNEGCDSNGEVYVPDEDIPAVDAVLADASDKSGVSADIPADDTPDALVKGDPDDAVSARQCFQLFSRQAP